MRCAAKHRPIPNANSTQHHWNVLLQRCRREMLVDGTHAIQHLVVHFWPEGNHVAQIDSRRNRIPPTNPLPHGKRMSKRDVLCARLLRVYCNYHAVLSNRIGAQRTFQPGGNRAAVSQCFACRKSLGAHHYQRALGIQALQRLLHAEWVDVGNKTTLQIGFHHRAQRFPHQAWPQVASANAHVDNVRKRFAGCTTNRAVAHAVGKLGHLFSLGRNRRRHV